MIRGFEFGGIGPYDSAPDAGNDHLGGTTYFNASVEAQFPMPVIPESFGIRGAVFADAATLYGNDINLAGVDVAGAGMEWRASVGAGLIWASPLRAAARRLRLALWSRKTPTKRRNSTSACRPASDQAG